MGFLNYCATLGKVHVGTQPWPLDGRRTCLGGRVGLMVGCSLAEEFGQEMLSCAWGSSSGIFPSFYVQRLRCGFGAVLLRVWYAVEECGYAWLAGLVCFMPCFGGSDTEKPATFIRWWFL